ncbi:MAG: GGDEF domain-containing protein [Nitrospirae bacterium]|nr:GGDEF domain-containing protein [Nitrospirota bacterium]
MSEQLFLKWLHKAFSEKGYTPVPLEGLSHEDILLAEKLQKECKRVDETLKRYSKTYLQALNGTEMFYEMAIRALSALINIGHLCGKLSDIDLLCDYIVDIFSQELEFENCSVMLTEPDGKYLRLVAGKGKGDKYSRQKCRRPGCKIKIGEGVAGTAVKSGEHIFIPDVNTDKRFKQINMKVDVASLLSVPIKSNKEIIGAINFSHPLLETFDENKINLMILLSNFVGQMITLLKLHNITASWNETLKKEIQEKTAELKKKNQKLHRIAVADSLTGIYNRRFFFMHLEEEFSRSVRYREQFALLVMDLDNLKPINDTYGHIVGDRVIKGIARFLKKNGRKGDVIGRIGGDEFGYILLNADEKAAYNFALRLQEALAKVELKGIKINPTFSIGIAVSPNPGFKKHQDIYKAADNALYSSKKKKNCVSVFGKSSSNTRQR